LFPDSSLRAETKLGIPVRGSGPTHRAGSAIPSPGHLSTQIAVLDAACAGTGFSFYLAGIDRTQNGKWFNDCYNLST
jgi:hypothetical protein